MGGNNKRLGILVATLGAVIVVGGGWVAYSEVSARLEAAQKAEGPRLLPAERPAALVLGKSVRETAERLDAPYRLGVDRRVRFAKSVLLGEGLKAPAEWQQSFDEDDPWSAERPFPRPLSFEEALGELTGIGTTAGSPGSTAERPVIADDPSTWLSAPEEALATIARETKGSAQPGDPLAAARAAISLLHGGVDRLGVADELGGVALAWLVQAERARNEERAMERAVLALELGYAESAARLGQKLRGGAWKARLTFDDAGLAKEAGGQALWYQRQSELGRAEERESWDGLPGKERFSLAGLAASLRSNRFETMGRSAAVCTIPLELRIAALSGADVKAPIEKLEAARSAEAIRQAVLEGRGSLIGLGVVSLGISLDTLSDLGRLDLWIRKAAERVGSPTAALVLEKYAEAHATSCLGTLVDYRFDSQGITPEARRKMAEQIFESKRPLFAQLKAWTELRALAATSAQSSAEIIATTKTLDRLGAPPKVDLFEDLKENIEFSSVEDNASLRMLAESLDTRPSGLKRAAQTLAELTVDLRYRDFFYEAWARVGAAADPGLTTWWKSYIGASESAPASDAPLREARLRSRLDPSIDDWTARQELTKFLADEGRDAEIPPVIEPWLKTHPDQRGFGREWALCTLAEVQLRAGKVTEAWKTWQPLQGSYKFSTMRTGTAIALARNDFLTATDLSTRALTRYPTSPHALELRLRVLWSTGRGEGAAEALRGLPKLPTLGDLDPVRDTFVDIYSEKTPEEARQAADQLLASGMTRSFIEVLADRFHKQKHFAHCAAVFELPTDSPLHQLQNNVWSYRCRKETMGKEQALAWLGSKVPPELRAPMVMFAFQRRLPELLWELPQPSESQQNSDSDYLWAMRAASQLWAGQPLDPRVTEHFKKETRMDSYAAIGRYLTGFIDEKTVLTAATNPRHANEVAYFLGMKAELDHRVADAIVWYRASVETHEFRSLEYSLAKGELYRFARTWRTLRSFTTPEPKADPGPESPPKPKPQSKPTN